ncbi:MAG: SoxR reducing system RseC family protein [Cetobacterium sp.]
MKSSGLVKEKYGNKLKVSIYKESACSHCNNCSDTSKISNTLDFICEDKNIEVGDVIKFELEDNVIFKSAFIVYIIPLVFLFLGYFLGDIISLSEGKKITMSFGGLVLAFLGIFIYDKFFIKSKVEKFIKIIEIEKK